MRPTVLLFDIDGTLVDTGGAGRRAVERAFHARHGRPDACASISFGGMTDRAICRGGLIAIGAAPSDDAIDALLEIYLDALLVAATAASSAISIPSLARNSGSILIDRTLPSQVTTTVTLSPAEEAVTSLSLRPFLTSSILRCMRAAWRTSSFIPPRNCMRAERMPRRLAGRNR